MRPDSDKIVFSLYKDEEIISSLLSFCEKNGIRSAWISGLGAVSEACLAFYDRSDKAYLDKQFTGDFELISLTGNISVLGEQLISHLHISISDKNFTTYSGHLKEAIVSVTCELFITKIQPDLKRKFNKDFKLNLLEQYDRTNIIRKHKE